MSEASYAAAAGLAAAIVGERHFTWVPGFLPPGELWYVPIDCIAMLLARRLGYHFTGRKTVVLARHKTTTYKSRENASQSNGGQPTPKPSSGMVFNVFILQLMLRWLASETWTQKKNW